MTVLSSFRQWWQPPKRTRDREEERSVTFLELFYDLVYVVVIAEVGHALASHVGVHGVLEFAFLFVLVWLAWLNGTLYHDLHGNNDIRTRIFTFAQMFTVASMAVFAHNAYGSGSAGFALSFAAYQLILTYLWWRTGVHDPDHRPLSNPYALAFLLSAILFFVSAFMPEVWRIYFWVAGFLLTIVGQMVTFSMRPSNPAVAAEQARSLTVTPSGVERFGLFTIIVLGEVIVGVVRGVASHHHLDWVVFVTAGLGMLIAIGLWWLYFDSVSQRFPHTGRWQILAWMMLHLVLSMGIVAVGAAVLNVVEHSGDALAAEVRWLLVGSMAVALTGISLLMPILQIRPEFRTLYRRAGLFMLAAALICVLLGLTALPAIPIMIIVVGLLLFPVIYGVKVWVQVYNAQEFTLDGE